MATKKTSTKSTKKSSAKSATTGKPAAKSSTKSASAKTAKRPASKTSKRTLIEPHKGDRRYVRRNKKGEFKTEVNVGRSLAADRRHKSKTKAGKGQGDRGDTGVGAGIIAAVKNVLKKI